jgi:hypothetical protein
VEKDMGKERGAFPLDSFRRLRVRHGKREVPWRLGDDTGDQEGIRN